MSDTSQPLNPELAEELASSLARKQLMDSGFTANINGNHIYKAHQGWECEALKRDEEIVSVNSVSELETAAENLSIDTIFVPESSGLTIEMVSRILARAGKEKIVFWEESA